MNNSFSLLEIFIGHPTPSQREASLGAPQCLPKQLPQKAAPHSTHSLGPRASPATSTGLRCAQPPMGTAVQGPVSLSPFTYNLTNTVNFLLRGTNRDSVLCLQVSGGSVCFTHLLSSIQKYTFPLSSIIKKIKEHRIKLQKQKEK